MSENPNRSLIGTGIIAFAVIASTMLLGNSVVRARGGGEIKVTGSARKDIDSDMIAWTGRIAYRSDTMGNGYSAVKTAISKLTDYLKSKGLTEKEIVIGAVQTTALYEEKKEGGYDNGGYRSIKGYDVSQAVTSPLHQSQRSRANQPRINRFDRSRRALGLRNSTVLLHQDRRRKARNPRPCCRRRSQAS